VNELMNELLKTAVKRRRERSLGRHRSSWEGNIKMCPTEIVWRVWIEFIRLWIGTSRRLF
jgi:hypothetical protein